MGDAAAVATPRRKRRQVIPSTRPDAEQIAQQAVRKTGGHVAAVEVVARASSAGRLSRANAASASRCRQQPPGSCSPLAGNSTMLPASPERDDRSKADRGE